MKNQINKGTLYIVATPIGNLQDITLRALEVLKQVEVIFAEDTRVTKKLLGHYAISAPQLFSCYAHNESSRLSQMIEQLSCPKSVALVSDAGTPLISDPGVTVVREIKAKGYPVVPIPGVSALTTALSAAGVATDGFQFYGFLPAKRSARQSVLSSIQHSAMTCVFYESKHRIISSLEDINVSFPSHEIVVAKELTKQFERFFQGNAQGILNQLNKDPVLCKGEFVILISGKKNIGPGKDALHQDRILKLLLTELPLKKAVQLATEITQGKKNDLYKKAIASQNG